MRYQQSGQVSTRVHTITNPNDLFSKVIGVLALQAASTKYSILQRRLFNIVHTADF
jgi:hypothetical protein